MNEIITPNGTTLYYKVSYDLGGYSHVTSRENPRGYTLHVQRQRNTFIAFQGLEHESGAVRLFLHEVKRKSKAQESIAYDMVPAKLAEITDRYGL